MFHLAVQSGHGGLSIAFDLVAPAGGIKDQAGQQGAKLGRDVMDLGFQILDEAAPGPGVLHHRRRSDHPQGAWRRAAAFDQRGLHCDKRLAYLGGHPSSPCLAINWYVGIP